MTSDLKLEEGPEATKTILVTICDDIPEAKLREFFARFSSDNNLKLTDQYLQSRSASFEVSGDFDRPFGKIERALNAVGVPDAVNIACKMSYRTAAAGGPAEIYARGRRILDLIHPYMVGTDAPDYKDALALFEEAGEAGHVEAMEYAVRLHASGLPNQQLVIEGSTYKSYEYPDWQKAHDWCVKAKEAGSQWAAEFYPDLCEVMAKAATPSSAPVISAPVPSVLR